MRSILIPLFLISSSTFIAIECGDEKKLRDSLLEKYRQFRPVSAPIDEELDRRIRAKALTQLRTAILPYTPDLLVNDLISEHTLLPNITTPEYVRVNTSGQCVERPVSGIFTDYHEYDLDVALVDVDWSRPITCPFEKCKVAFALEFQSKSRRYSNESVLAGKRSWILTTDAVDRAVEIAIREDVDADMSSVVQLDDVRDTAENDTRDDESTMKDQWMRSEYSYEFVLDQNKTLVTATVVVGVTCRRIPYELLEIQPQTKFNLFNINVSECPYVQNVTTGCLTRCEHFIVAGMTPKGLARHAHRLCWWDFFREKIFLVRENPLKLCDYDPKELVVPVRDDGTLFSAQFWFEHGVINAT